MTVVRLAGVTVTLAALLVSATACDTAPARAAQTAPATVWRPLGHWTGTGSRQTESFDVVSGARRLQRETRATSGAGAGRWRVWLYSGISGRPLQLVVEGDGAGTGTAYVADDPRVSYLVIEAERVAWTATLEEAVVAAARP